MAGSAGDRTERYILEHLVGKTTWAVPTVACALCTAGPGDAGSGSGINEVANSNNYARKATAGLWNSAAAGAIDNSGAITFNQASGSWGTVTHFALVSSATWGEGYVLCHGDLTTPKAIGNGDTPSFAAGDLDITCD
jgi:hypothetical protein